MSRITHRPNRSRIKYSFYFKGLRGAPLVGTPRAYLLLHTFIACYLMSASCLVTDRIEFKEEKNLPPAFLDTTERKTPMGSMIKVNLSDFDDESVPQEVKFELQVRDENVTQILETRYDLTTLESDGHTSRLVDRDFGPQLISGGPLRPVELTIEKGRFLPAGSCFLLELFVSSKFESWDKPVAEGDIATARWLIAVSSQAVPQVDFNTCPNLEYTPLEYTNSEVPDI
jgi:hypothetical protein